MSRFMSELFEEWDEGDEGDVDVDATTELPRVAAPQVNPDPTAPLFPPKDPPAAERGERNRIDTDEVLGKPVGPPPGRFQRPETPQDRLEPTHLVSEFDRTRKVTQINVAMPGIIVNAYSGPDDQTMLVFEHVTTKEEFEIIVSPPVLARLMQAGVKAMGWYAKQFQTETDRHEGR